jgi:hypothetical protein
MLLTDNDRHKWAAKGSCPTLRYPRTAPWLRKTILKATRYNIPNAEAPEYEQMTITPTRSVMWETNATEHTAVAGNENVFNVLKMTSALKERTYLNYFISLKHCFTIHIFAMSMNSIHLDTVTCLVTRNGVWIGNWIYCTRNTR